MRLDADRRDPGQRDPAAVTNSTKCRRETRWMTHDLKGDVDALAAGEGAKDFSGVRVGGVHYVGRADLARGVELVVGEVDRDHLRRAKGSGHLDRRGPDTSCTNDRYGLTAANLGRVPEEAIGREECAADHRRRNKVDGVGRTKDRRSRYDRVLGERGHRVHRNRFTVVEGQSGGAVVERPAKSILGEEGPTE